MININIHEVARAKVSNGCHSGVHWQELNLRSANGEQAAELTLFPERGEDGNQLTTSFLPPTFAVENAAGILWELSRNPGINDEQMKERIKQAIRNLGYGHYLRDPRELEL